VVRISLDLIVRKRLKEVIFKYLKIVKNSNIYIYIYIYIYIIWSLTKFLYENQFERFGLKFRLQKKIYSTQTVYYT
jgi:hypothetical protein